MAPVKRWNACANEWCDGTMPAYRASHAEVADLVTGHIYTLGSWRVIEWCGMKAEVGVCVCGRDWQDHACPHERVSDSGAIECWDCGYVFPENPS